MAKLLQEIRITVFGNTRELHFADTEDIHRWLDAEEPCWPNAQSRIKNSQLNQIWGEQVGCFSNIRTYVKKFEASIAQEDENGGAENFSFLNKWFQKLVRGTVLTSDHAYYPVIAELVESNIEAAAYVLGAARSDGDQQLKGWFAANQFPIQALNALILNRGKTEKSADWLAPQRKELGQLKSDYQTKLNELRAVFNEQIRANTEQHRQEGVAQEQRQSDWGRWKTELSEEWVKLKKVYDEQLALQAPTQYWSQRAKTHRSIAIGFAIAFGLALTGGVAAFVCWAMPGLLNAAGNKDASVLLTLAPLLVPVFASIWVLKILSRLLSENLQLMRDARERETMVKTFLALMRDDQSGKALVQDNDRILILHALFRPSSLSAVDDAPPVHWFDILTNKVGQK
jgi:ribosomal protein S20